MTEQTTAEVLNDVAGFAEVAGYHAHVDKSDRAKKNMYFTGKDVMQRMSDALKYIFK